jgi:hypothetical protein
MEKEENLLSNIFMFLEASDTYWQIVNTEGKWILRVMRGYFLDTRVFNNGSKYVMESINVVIDDASIDRVPDVQPDFETSLQETNAPTQMSELETKKEETEQMSRIMCQQAKDPLSEFRRIILKIL